MFVTLIGFACPEHECTVIRPLSSVFFERYPKDSLPRGSPFLSLSFPEINLQEIADEELEAIFVIGSGPDSRSC
jgi:hypothetical protein